MLSYLVLIATACLVLGTALPFSKIPFGALRGLDFPRQQFCLVAGMLMVLAPFVLAGSMLGWTLVALIAVLVAQSVQIAKFTSLWPQQSVDATEAQRQDGDRQISVLAANVKLSNRDYDRLIACVGQRQPDVLLAIEVDEDWISALHDALGADYPHRIDVPRDNGYGMCILSRLALSEVDVREVITKAVPSVRARVTLRNGRAVRLYVVHPEPPVIDHDTKGRDSEIAQIALEAAEDPLPAIVSGDLNDVAWSTTTRRFQRLSGLLDPRVGRGFYNTFSATMPWMRWPLDHLFHDPQFRLVNMARLGKIGSDHFPIWFVLALADQEGEGTTPEEAGADERQEAKEMISAEKQRDREAIGSDWEEG